MQDLEATIAAALTSDYDALRARDARIRRLANERPRLKPEDIRTTEDLDIYRWQNPLPNGHIESCYGVLCRLYGQHKADRIMRNLEVASW